MATRSKAKGNSFEIKTAKMLSNWMFNDDPNILWRDSTSGGRKVIYNGDIIPASVDKFNWRIWPFIIETKHGYKDHIPTFMNFKKVKEWLVKLLSERTETQYIPILIAQFHNCHSILITTMILQVYCDISLKILGLDNNFYDFYIYDFKSVLDSNFEKTIPPELYNFLIN